MSSAQAIGSFDAIGSVLSEVDGAFSDARIDHVLIGGIASSALGRPRSTEDVDVFVAPGAASAALGVLGTRGFDTDRLDEAWIFKASKHGVCVDLIFYTRYGIYLDAEMLERSRRLRYRGASVRVVSPEDLMIMKAVSMDEATPRHWYDALALLARPDLDWDYLLARSRRAQRRVLSLILYAQSIDYFIPAHVVEALAGRVSGR